MFQQKIQGRLNWYKSRFQVNNPVVGRVVELLGNKVRMDGLTYSVACPSISTGHKSTLAFGLHEIEERALIRRWLHSDVPVLEFGGGIGVVSCLINRKLRNQGQHIVVEANPAMVPVLKRNRDLNSCKFQIVNKAIAYDGEFVDLTLDQEFVGSSTKSAGSNSVRVAATTITKLMDEAGLTTVGIVCDIEGVEADIIRRELPALGKRVSFFMAEMHPAILGAVVVEELLRDIETLGFDLCERIGNNVFFERSEDDWNTK